MYVFVHMGNGLLEILMRYLSMDMLFILKTSVANFSCSSHVLQIEKGHDKTDRDFRFSPFCLKRNVYVIEDEVHFLLLCPLYDEIINLYLKEQIGNCYISLNLFYLLL